MAAQGPEEIRELLEKAAVALENEDFEAAAALAASARTDCDSWLARLGTTPESWVDWTHFHVACRALETGWSVGFGKPVLRHRLREAIRHLDLLAANLDGLAAEISERQGRIAALEGLLDCVWKCEENWRLDDRLEFALRPRRPPRR